MDTKPKERQIRREKTINGHHSRGRDRKGKLYTDAVDIFELKMTTELQLLGALQRLQEAFLIKLDRGEPKFPAVQCCSKVLYNSIES